MESLKIQALKREGNGTGDARATRREGRIPAIIYGGKGEEVSITLETKELVAAYEKGWFTSRLVSIEMGKEKVRAIPREVQVHPVTDVPMHVDFQRVEDGDSVRVQVPIRFFNNEKSPGLKRGGVLNRVRRSIELICPVDNIPDGILADLNGLKIKDSIHYSKLEIPEGCTPVITDRDFTIAAIAGRVTKEEREAQAADAEAAEAEA